MRPRHSAKLSMEIRWLTPRRRVCGVCREVPVTDARRCMCRCSVLRCPMQCAAMADAVRCIICPKIYPCSEEW